jgi:alpha-N-arabinofuranosidase
MGHADIVCDQKGHWWLVCLGIRPVSYPPYHVLGRETFLAPVVWNEEGWPVVGNGGVIEPRVDLPDLPEVVQQPVGGFVDRFESSRLDPRWNHIHAPVSENYSPGQEGIILRGSESTLDDRYRKTFLGTRQRHHACRIAMEIDFLPRGEADEAGLTVFYNEQHHYEIGLTMRQGERCVVFRRRIGSLRKEERVEVVDTNPTILEVEAQPEWYSFFYGTPGPSDVLNRVSSGRGEARFLSKEVAGGYTGVYFGMYATSPRATTARVRWFRYKVET